MRTVCSANVAKFPTNMPNLDFYAAGEDYEPIVNFVLTEERFRVFESYSRPDQALVEIKSFEHFREHFSLELNGRNTLILLQLFAAGGSGEPLFRRIELKQGAMGNAKFRFACEGWGLIQLQFALPKQQMLRPSHTNHNSEKRAIAWAGTFQDRLGSPTKWAWKEIERASRQLNTFIRKLSVEKVGSRPVLPNALQLRDGGTKFIG
jgi:hypothetical protein